MTKLQVLRYACHYISDLSEMLCSDNQMIQQQQQQQQQSSPVSDGSASDLFPFPGYGPTDTYNPPMDILQGLQHNVNGINIMQRIDYLASYHDRLEHPPPQMLENFYMGFK